MILSLPKVIPLKDFIEKFCSHLLNAPQSDTGTSSKEFEISEFKLKGKTLTKRYTKSLTAGIHDSAGVSSFFSPKTNKIYIGSNTKSGSRLKGHYQGSKLESDIGKFTREVKKLGVWNILFENRFLYLKFII